MPRILVLAFAFLFSSAAAAQAGTYHVYTCVADGKTWANGAWKAAVAPGVLADSSCAGNTIALTVPAGARTPNGASGSLTFTSPPGTSIADFALTRQIGFN